jgi:murein DD-endopeptidase MepM/ murein hydrolase activator NlpD
LNPRPSIERPRGRSSKLATYLAIVCLPLLGGLATVAWTDTDSTAASPSQTEYQPRRVATLMPETEPGTRPENLATPAQVPLYVAADAMESEPPREAEIANSVDFKLAESRPIAANLPDIDRQSAALDPIGQVSSLESGMELANLRTASRRPGLVERKSAPTIIARNVVVSRGDTLMKLLVDAGVDRQEAHAAITSLRDVFRPRDIRPGLKIQLAFAASNDPEASDSLVSMLFKPNVEQDIAVTRDTESGFVSRAIDHPLERALNSASGTIESSLSLAGQEAEVPANILITAIRAFSYDVDFQREIQKGDSFEFFYETYHDRDGNLAKSGKVLYAALTLSGKRREFYNYELSDGTSDYFAPNGESVRKALMRTPVDGARLSSGFGMRKHPVLGYSKMHRGVDFAAPRGTPVYAAGRGVIELAGRNGGYGKYIRIRHNSNYKTAYAHLHRIAKGIRKGKRVNQGQVIGYVGSTGRSTGPHLHYEMIFNGKQLNPRKVKMPKGEKLKGKELERFQQAQAEIDRLRAAQEGLYLVESHCGPRAYPRPTQPAQGSC